MKKLLLVGAVALFGAMNAQEVKFGAKAGYSLSTLKIDADGESFDYDAKSTFYVGGLVEYKLNDKFALQGELLYSPLGGKNKTSSSQTLPLVGTVSYTEEDEVKFGTLQIPVSAKYYVTESLALGAGLNFGIITSAKSEYNYSYNGGGINESESGSEDIKDYTKSLNLAPFIGAEYNLTNGLFFDARYNIGVSNLADESGVDMKNSFLQVGIGYKFGK